MSDQAAVPLLRYPGAKNQLAEWIVNHLPACDSYCEPYAGSAAVLLNKTRSPMEAVNDLNGDMVNLFRMLRDNPVELINAIHFTPWSSAEYQLARQTADDPIEQARRFYFHCWASIKPFNDAPSFRRQKVLSRGRNGQSAPMTPAAKQFMRTDHLYQIAERLRGVTLESMDALDFIQLYDNPGALFYCDPPYPHNTRQAKDLYLHEMSNKDHYRMAAVLHGVGGMVVLSGYACPLYDELFGSWKRVEREARINGGGSNIESLWLSPRTYAALQDEHRPAVVQQMGLWSVPQ